MLLEMNDGEQHHGNCTATGCGDGSTFDTKLRTTPMTEDQRIVAKDIEHVDDTRDNHRPNHLVGTTQRSRES